MEVLLGIGSFIAAFVMYKILTRPDPKERVLIKELHKVLNDPQYRVKNKHE